MLMLFLGVVCAWSARLTVGPGAEHPTLAAAAANARADDTLALHQAVHEVRATVLLEDVRLVGSDRDVLVVVASGRLTLRDVDVSAWAARAARLRFEVSDGGVLVLEDQTIRGGSIVARGDGSRLVILQSRLSNVPIVVETGADGVVQDTTLSGVGDAPAVSVLGGHLAVVDSVVRDNRGGDAPVVCTNSAHCFVERSLFVGNESRRAGAIRMSGGWLAWNRSRACANVADQGPGALKVEGGRTSIQQGLFANNRGSTTGDLELLGGIVTIQKSMSFGGRAPHGRAGSLLASAAHGALRLELQDSHFEGAPGTKAVVVEPNVDQIGIPSIPADADAFRTGFQLDGSCRAGAVP